MTRLASFRDRNNDCAHPHRGNVSGLQREFVEASQLMVSPGTGQEVSRRKNSCGLLDGRVEAAI